MIEKDETDAEFDPNWTPPPAGDDRAQIDPTVDAMLTRLGQEELVDARRHPGPAPREVVPTINPAQVQAYREAKGIDPIPFHAATGAFLIPYANVRAYYAAVQTIYKQLTELPEWSKVVDERCLAGTWNPRVLAEATRGSELRIYLLGIAMGMAASKMAATLFMQDLGTRPPATEPQEDAI